MGIISKAIGYVLSLIYGVVGNYGWSIILLTLLVRILMLPLAAKQITYSSKMAVLQDQVKDIQTRFAKDQQRMNQELTKLYADNGVSPTSGCLPLVIQFPLIIGLFSLLRSPLTYISQSNMIMAVHESFYWIADLSQPDNWILPILAGITTYLTTATTSGTSGSSALNGVAMKYLYPVMIILLARSFPAGLSIYWVVGNGFAVVQTIIMNKMRAKDDLEAEALRIAKKNVAKKNSK